MNPYLVKNIIDSKIEANYTGHAQNERVWDTYLCSSVGSVQELKAKGPGFESQSDLFFVLFFSFVVYPVTIKLRK